jgi:hypothetical protein
MRQQAFDTDQRAVVYAPGERPSVAPGDHVRILSRTPAAPHRMPFYLLGKRGMIESVTRSAAIDNEETLSLEWPSQRWVPTTVSPSQ